MRVAWVGVRRLALVLGVVGALIGLAACVAAFVNVRQQMSQYDRVQNALRTGLITAHADGALWWKDLAGQEHPFVEAVPQERPIESDAWWAVLLPVAGFLVPWGCVIAISWIAAGFLGQSGGRRGVDQHPSELQPSRSGDSGKLVLPSPQGANIFCGECGASLELEWDHCTKCGTPSWKSQK
jgi:hypothetical protein